jgi:hypothetical protein
MRTLEQIVLRFKELKEEYIDHDGKIYDAIHYQLSGIYDDYEENEGDEDLIRKLNMLVDHLEIHLNYIKTAPKFNWIY